MSHPCVPDSPRVVATSRFCQVRSNSNDVTNPTTSHDSNGSCINIIDTIQKATTTKTLKKTSHNQTQVNPAGIPRMRHGRVGRRTGQDSAIETSFGDSILKKEQHSVRLFFQNVKGLTYSVGCEDYRYYFSCMAAYGVDIFGLAETNTAWSHHHLCSEFRRLIQLQFRRGKTVFSSPSIEVDKCAPNENHQPGGTVMVAHGHYATITTNGHLEDASRLGRWSSASFSGTGGKILHVITAYRTCNGSIQTAPIGSTFLREYDFFASKVMCVQIPGHTSFETSSPSLLHYQCLPEHPLFLCWTQMQPWIKKLYLRSLSPRAIYMTYIMQVRLHRHILDHLTAGLTSFSAIRQQRRRCYGPAPYLTSKDLSQITVVCLSISTRECLDLITRSRILHLHGVEL